MKQTGLFPGAAYFSDTSPLPGLCQLMVNSWRDK